MMGYSHAVSGALGWLVLAPTAGAVVGIDLTTSQMAAGALACAGAALLPDLDHPQATIAQFLGPPSQLLAKGVNLLAGGHRMATHSFLFCILAGLGTFGLQLMFGVKASLWVMFIMTALALRALGLCPPGKKSSIMTGAAIAIESAAITYAVAAYASGGWGFLPLAVALGCLFHVGGDCCTPERCPIFWPSRKRYGFGVIQRTGNSLETKIIAPLMGVAVLGLCYQQFLGPYLGSPTL